MSKLVLASLILLPLCACSSAPQVQTHYFGINSSAVYDGSYPLGPTSASDPRLRDPHFYMDDDGAPRWFLLTQPPGR